MGAFDRVNCIEETQLDSLESCETILENSAGQINRWLTAFIEKI